jgi:DNA-binding HxlR family transcriptional regulator
MMIVTALGSDYPMRRKSFARQSCPIARSVEITGDAWCLLILRNAFLGLRYFQEFEERMGIAPTTLARKLSVLTQAGLLERQSYSERPPRERYELTAMGRDFLPVLLALATWGNRWLAPEGAAIECAEPETGRTLDPVLIDRSSGRELSAGTVALKPGPAAGGELRKSLSPPRVLGVHSKHQQEPA